MPHTPTHFVAQSEQDWAHPRSIGGINLLIRFAEAEGVEPAELLADTGLSPDQVDDGATLVEAHQEIAAVRNLVARLDRPGLGVEVGAPYHLTTFGIYGYALLSCATIAESFRVAIEYAELSYAFSTIRASLEGRDGDLVVAYDASSAPCDLRRFLVERDMAASVRMQRDILGDSGRVQLHEVRFAFPEVDPAPYVAFFDAPVHFGCERTELRYDRDYPRVVGPQADPVTAAECRRMCEQLIARRRARTGTAARVRALLLEGDVHRSMEAVARELLMAPRTLRRQLAQEGTSFRAIADEVRQGLAVELVDQQGLPTALAAERLGYQDPSSFLRALRRWREHAG